MNEEYYINLIYKSIEGALAASEQEELDIWLKKSEENRKTYTSVKVAWKHAEKDVKMPDIDLDAEFDLLQEKIDTEESDTVISINRVERKPLNARWITVAASVVILFGAAFFFKDILFGSTWIEVNTGENTQTIVLADQSEVVLNTKSTFWYKKEFSGNQRLVRLQGEAFFKISRDETKPFIIETEGEKVQVLGTSFNVRAYPGEEESTVYVATGKVRFTSKQQNDELILTQNNQGIFNRKTKAFRKLKEGSLNAISWIKQELIFNNTPLKKVVKELEQHYKVDLSLKNKRLEECTFTGRFSDEPLEDVLETISLVLSLEVEKKAKSEYIISGSSCK